MTCLELAGKSVLVVDDEPQILFLIERLLMPYDCQVLTAHTVLEAHALYDKHRADIVLVMTDIMMPDINGLDFIKSLRLRDSRVPIVIVSVLANKSRLADHMDEMKISAWLNKPFKNTDFKQLVMVLLHTDGSE